MTQESYKNKIPQIEGLYMIHTYTCISNNEYIYKIGRSNNLYNRITNYSNGSVCYLVIESMESKVDESEVLKIFNNKYKNIKFYGNEYFEGDKNDMIKTIENFVKNKYSKPRIISKNFELITYNKDNQYINPCTRGIYKLFLEDKYKISKITIKNVEEIYINNLKVNSEDDICGNDIESVKNNYDCSICYKKFNSPSHLQRHNNKKNNCVKPNVDIKLLLNNYLDDTNNEELVSDIFCKIVKNVKSIDLIKKYQMIIDTKLQSLEDKELTKNIFKCNYCNQEFLHKTKFSQTQ